MCHDLVGDDKLWLDLDAEDARIAARVKAAGCRYCGARLDVASYPRKPRGGIGTGPEKRRSFCCSREGCRRRATPPSTMFLGRRVYLAAVVLVESLRAAMSVTMAPPLASSAGASSSPPARTVRRWLDWFRSTLPKSTFFTAAGGRLWPLVSADDLPQDLVARFAVAGRSAAEVVVAALRFLAPLSTASVLLEATLPRA